MAMRAEARSRTFFPQRSATPKSVTTQRTSPRLVTTPAPCSCTAMMRLTVPFLAVERSARIGLPPRLRLAPRMKSTWPPIPEKNLPSSVSDATWPVRSTASTELTEIIRSLRAMVNGSLVKSLGRISTAGLSWTHSYSFRVPITKDVTILPASSVFLRPVMTPASAVRGMRGLTSARICRPCPPPRARCPRRHRGSRSRGCPEGSPGSAPRRRAPGGCGSARNLGEEGGHEVCAALVDRVAEVGADEERGVGEAALVLGVHVRGGSQRDAI